MWTPRAIARLLKKANVGMPAFGAGGLTSPPQAHQILHNSMQHAPNPSLVGQSTNYGATPTLTSSVTPHTGAAPSLTTQAAPTLTPRTPAAPQVNPPTPHAPTAPHVTATAPHVGAAPHPLAISPMSGKFGLIAGGIRAADSLTDGDFTGAALNAGIGYGMHRMSQLPGAQNVVQHALTPTAARAAARPVGRYAARAAAKPLLATAGKVLAKNIVPGVGAALSIPAAVGKWREGDYLGAGLNALSGAANFIPGFGVPISMGLDALSAGRDFYNNKLASENVINTMSTSSDYRNTHTKAFARGFVKAAAAKGVSFDDFGELVKKALARNDGLTTDDILRIRKELTTQGEPTPYADPSGEAMRTYKARMLTERDRAIDEIPAVSGAMSGIGAGALGAALAGTLGAVAGHGLRESNLLNIPYRYLKHAPMALGIPAAVVGGLAAALPAAQQRYDASKAFKKLHDPRAIRDLDQYNQSEQQLLNS